MKTFRLFVCALVFAGCATHKTAPVSAHIEIADTVSRSEVKETRRVLAETKGYDLSIPIDKIVKAWPDYGECIWVYSGHSFWELKRDAMGHLRVAGRGSCGF